MKDDIEITITDNIDPPLDQKSNLTNGFDFLQLPQLPLTQLGYPHAHEWIQHKKATLRPWSLFINTNNIRSPPSITRLSKRIMKNIEVTSPLLLLTVVASLGTCYKVSQVYARQGLMVLNHKLTLAQVYMLIGICSLPLFYLVGAGAVLFWVLGVSWCLVTLHAAFYNIDSVLCPGEDELNALVMQDI
ncbi:hypothetical protein PV325_009241 [Microctonus aethiopoides]|nr:hypothetical protein PV325_009241 [Microctonus aethiopoides]